MRAPNFANLASALVFTAELDPLRDEGEVYADKLKNAGSPVELIRMPNVPHPFPHLDGILDAGKKYNEKVVATLKREFRE